MTPAQCRAARALVDLSQTEVARLATVSRTVVVDFEAGVFKPKLADLKAIQAALEACGVEFADGGEGPAVGLKGVLGTVR